jgi:hypothetical protein
MKRIRERQIKAGENGSPYEVVYDRGVTTIWLWNLTMKFVYEIPGLDNFLSCFINSFTVLYQWCMNERICFDLKLLPNNNTIYTVKSRREKYNYIFYVLILIYFICKG